MKKRVEKLIPKALEAAQRYLAKDGAINEAYNGYIATFGASVRQAGLLATILFFSKKSEKTKADRTKILRAIEYILDFPQNKIIDFTDKKDDILDAAIALKLAIRAYALIKEDG